MISSLIKKNRLDLLSVFLLLLTVPLFFYKLGQSSLGSFDEAWYGSVARNILESGNWLYLSWNGSAFTDHPPAVFWLIALSEKILGINEFAVRFPAAILGLLSLVVIYFLGKELFGRWVGFASAIALSSATWFLFRARSGNLDVPLTFFFLLSLFLAVKAFKDKRFNWPLSVSLIFLFLSKTLVPFTIIPVLLLIFWKDLKKLILPLGVSLTVFIIWLIAQSIPEHTFLMHYFKIGLPGIKEKTDYLANFNLVRQYLHNGIGRWFWPGVLGVVLSPIFIKKKFLIFPVFMAVFLIPFLFSEKGQIWHLIPLYPILILAFFAVGFEFLNKLTKKSFLAGGVVIAVCLYLTFIQTKQNWYQFINIPAYVSDEAILSAEAGKYPEKFYIDGDFSQAATFYSDKTVKKISYNELIPIFKQADKALLIVTQNRLDEAKIATGSYQIIKKDRDKILLLKRIFTSR